MYLFLHTKLINNSDHFVSLNFDLIICPLKAFWWLLSYKSIIVTIIIITNTTTILADQNIRLLYPLHSLYFAFWITTHKMSTCIYLMQDLDKLTSLCGQWIWGHISHFIPIWKKNLQLSKHWSSNDFFPSLAHDWRTVWKCFSLPSIWRTIKYASYLTAGLF